MRKSPNLLLLYSFLILLLAACQPKQAEQPEKPVLVDKPEMINEEIQKLLTEKCAEKDSNSVLVIKKDSLFSSKWMYRLYTDQHFMPLWTDKGHKKAQADSLLRLIETIGDYGLLPQDYHLEEIKELFKHAQDSISKKYDAVKLCQSDILLTDAFFSLCVHIRTGRLNADSLTREWHGDQMDTNMVALFLSSVNTNCIHETIDSLEPQTAPYQALKLALKNYKTEFEGIEWDSLASRASDSTGFNERLKKRLTASHDYFDEYSGSDSIKLLKAVKNIQCRYNLTEDGKIGKLTFRALQQTKEDVIRQIELNMERWRWKQPPPEKRFVWVNIPKYKVRVMEDDTLVLESRVIVGQPDHQTPQLKSTIRYFIIYPYWNVPFSIATKELLPILKRDTSYLRRKNFEVLDAHNAVMDPSKINWKRYSKTYFPWRLRQRIGDDNSLGILKFNFENKYGVYMHDTDNRKLFNREMRALSHGCVRVDKFFDFAKFLIREDSVKYPVDSLEEDLLREKQKYVYIRKPIAVYINYYTAEVDDNNALQLFIDIYRKDEKMRSALEQKKID